MIIPVILAGGSGTRLWPLSRKLYPKQLIKLTDDYTMLQNTLLRLADFDGMAEPIIICNESHRFIVAEQLREIKIKPAGIFLEPVGRNTAPAVSVSAIKAIGMDADALILILPADHLIGDIPTFHDTLRTGEHFANQGDLITFGIVPDRPETGYGYIRKGEPADGLGDNSSAMAQEAFAIHQFVEKPDLETAAHYLSTGDYCWNSGMFMFKAAIVLEEMRRYAPDIVTACETSFEKGKTKQGFFYLDRDAFEKCPADSIDYAIMEKTGRGVMIPFNAGWDDWPFLFYFNDHNNYLVGLDPIFMYAYDADKYKLWFKIINGNVKENLASIIIHNFNSRYVVLSKKRKFKRFIKILTNNPNISKIFEDSSGFVYEIKAPL